MTTTPCLREQVEQRERAWLAPFAVLSERGGARPCPEPPDPYRTCFVRDRDRVLHCAAFRRLRDKTQVFVADEGDFYRTRLTHSLEVSQVARWLARALRLNEGLVEALALVHDIGHPPFGHRGERALGDVLGVPFDHNLQALRLVDVLEQPYADDRPGLNLTQIVRRSILKHGGDPGRGATPTRQHVLEQQVADVADSTAYRHHDLEDGLRAGLIAEEELRALDIWIEAREAVTDAGTSVQRQRATLSALLTRSLQDVVETTLAALDRADVRTVEDVTDADTVFVRRGAELARRHDELGAFLLERFYQHPRVLRARRIADDAIAILAGHYREHLDELPNAYRQRIGTSGPERVVCDYIAGMTDRFALDEAARLRARGAARGALVPRAGGDAAPAGPTGGDAGGPDHAPDELVLAPLERRLGYAFADRTLLETALTHRSARTDAVDPNERLEFLGDSVLGLLVAEDLYRRFPDREEGELSRIRSVVVSRRGLSRVQRAWGLEAMMRLGPGMRAAERMPPSVAADAVEAVLGAAYLDGGLEAARGIVARAFTAAILEAADRSRSQNHKSTLQTLTQGRLGATPHYRLLTEEGPDHEKLFTVAAMIGDDELATATGKNKRQAEQAAARRALDALRDRLEEEEEDASSDSGEPPAA